MKGPRGYIMILCAATLWGLSATAAKELQNQHLETLLIVQTRVSFSCLILLGLYLVFKPELLKVRPKDLVHFALIGTIGVAGSNFTYYYMLKESSVATAILIQYTAPLFVMAYGAITKEEKFTLVKFSAAVVSLLGCYLAFGAYDSGTLRMSKTGALVGASSVFCFAFLTVYTRRVLARYSAWTVVLYSLIFASALWLVVNPPWKIMLNTPESGMWGILVLFAVMSILIPHTLYFGGLRLVVPSRAIITSSVEPIVAIVSAAVVLGEHLGQVQVIGAALVIGAIVLLQLRAEPAGMGGPQAPLPEQMNAT